MHLMAQTRLLIVDATRHTCTLWFLSLRFSFCSLLHRQDVLCPSHAAFSTSSKHCTEHRMSALLRAELHAKLISALVTVTTLALRGSFSVAEVPNSMPRRRSIKPSCLSELKERLFVPVWPSAATKVECFVRPARRLNARRQKKGEPTSMAAKKGMTKKTKRPLAEHKLHMEFYKYLEEGLTELQRCRSLISQNRHAPYCKITACSLKSTRICIRRSSG